MGVLLRPGQRSQVLALTRGLVEHDEEMERPVVWFSD
jgi:hypothetical protein